MIFSNIISWVYIPYFLIYVFTALLSTAIAYQIIYNHFFHPLSRYPGPFWAGVTRNWIAWHNFMEDETAVCWELVQKHGPVVRISPNLLLVAKSEYIPDIYHRRAVKTAHYNLLGFGRTPSAFHSIVHADHAQQRRLVANAYAFSSVKETEGIVDFQIQAWISKLRELFCGKEDLAVGKAFYGEPFDFAPWASYLAYDIMGRVGFGIDLECTKNGHDNIGLIKGFRAGLQAFGFVTRNHVAAEWVNWSFIGRFLEWQVPRDNTIGVLMRFGKKLLFERLEGLKDPGKEKKNDMLQRLLDARDPDGRSMSLESIHGELTVILLAGADTLSTATCAIIIYVLSSPQALARILSEIKSVRAKGLLSQIPQQHEVLTHCPFYVACVKESMRLCPSVQSIFPRLVTTEYPLMLEGKAIPAGTEVACNPWITHRDPEIYGQNAGNWRPERWLENEGESGRIFDKYNLGLGYGSRICLGRELGIMELMKSPLVFLESFEAKLVGADDGYPQQKLTCTGGVAAWEKVWMSIQET